MGNLFQKSKAVDEEDDSDDGPLAQILLEFDVTDHNKELECGVDFTSKMGGHIKKPSLVRSSSGRHQHTQSASLLPRYETLMLRVDGMPDEVLSQGTNEHSDLSSAPSADSESPLNHKAATPTIDHEERKRQMNLLLRYGAVLLFIVVSEVLYREPLYEASLERLIPRLQHSVDRAGLLTSVYYLGKGSELFLLFLYHMIISGKYHRAFLVSIFIS